jgi:hypothetical protein
MIVMPSNNSPDSADTESGYSFFTTNVPKPQCGSFIEPQSTKNPEARWLPGLLLAV